MCFFLAVFLNLFTYMAQITFGKNCVIHYFVSTGHRLCFYMHKQTQYAEVAGLFLDVVQ